MEGENIKEESVNGPDSLLKFLEKKRHAFEGLQVYISMCEERPDLEDQVCQGGVW